MLYWERKGNFISNRHLSHVSVNAGNMQYQRYKVAPSIIMISFMYQKLNLFQMLAVFFYGDTMQSISEETHRVNMWFSPTILQGILSLCFVATGLLNSMKFIGTTDFENAYNLARTLWKKPNYTTDLKRYNITYL